MNNIQNINCNFFNIGQIKGSLLSAKGSVSSGFFLNNTEEKKKNIDKILNALDPDSINISQVINTDAQVGLILNSIKLLKLSENVQDQTEELCKLNKLIENYLGTHRTNFLFRCFYILTKTSTSSLRAYHNSHKYFSLEKLKNYSQENWSDNRLNFINLCKDYKTLFGDNKVKDLLISIIDYNLNENRLDVVINLLNLSKKYLLTKANKYYKNKIIEVFTKIDDYKKLERFIKKHPDCIDYSQKKIIIKKYEETQDINIVKVICDALINKEAINLPPREISYRGDICELGDARIFCFNQFWGGNSHNSIIIKDIESIMLPKGIAYDIHNYSRLIIDNFVEVLTIFLRENNVEVDKKFNSEELMEVINNVHSLPLEKKDQIKEVVNKLLNSKDDYYIDKFTHIIPILVAFLNNNNLWSEKYSCLSSRWKLWLDSSLSEAYKAYDNVENSISCVRGIYERLVTGFIKMHPLVDMYFLVPNFFEASKQKLHIVLGNKILVDDVIKKLKKQNIKYDSQNFRNKIYEIYKDELVELLKKDIDDSHRELKLELESFQQKNQCSVVKTKKITEYYVELFKNTLFKNICVKLKLSEHISQLEYIQINLENNPIITLSEYIELGLQKI